MIILLIIMMMITIIIIIMMIMIDITYSNAPYNIALCLVLCFII